MARLIDIGLERVSDILLDMAVLSEKSVSASIEAYTSGKNQMDEIHTWSEEVKTIAG